MLRLDADRDCYVGEHGELYNREEIDIPLHARKGVFWDKHKEMLKEREAHKIDHREYSSEYTVYTKHLGPSPFSEVKKPKTWWEKLWSR